MAAEGPVAAEPGDSTLGLFEAYGIELEYMIVDARSLEVAPIADRLIEAESGGIENEIERADYAWSNELARHVIEVKTNGPAPSLVDLRDGFAGELRRMNELLAPMGARLMSTAMHPWMDATRDFEIWPHGAREIYETFDRIFDCRGHGWANLQSMHLNLPFRNDEEFGRLHASTRALLPLLPALAASSPYLEGRASGRLDTRLEVYRANARRVPSVSGAVIPEAVFTRADYEALLESIYQDLAPLDPQGILRHEWVNARGCIARFDRMALEIRVLDLQEAPVADIAIAAVVSHAIRSLCGLGPAAQQRLRALETGRLAGLLSRTIDHAEGALIDDVGYLEALQLGSRPKRAGELWAALIDRYLTESEPPPAVCAALRTIRDRGGLATRIRRRVAALGGDVDEPDREVLRSVYLELAEGLDGGRSFDGGD
jgi:gamma-glutamyl:cysteine ligase YbdK (ATP-grasp superfamily)